MVLANIKSAKKRIKVNDRNALRNKMFKSMIKTNIRKACAVQDENEKENILRIALSSLDKAVNKGILKRNTADRKKSLVARRCKQA